MVFTQIFCKASYILVRILSSGSQIVYQIHWTFWPLIVRWDFNKKIKINLLLPNPTRHKNVAMHEGMGREKCTIEHVHIKIFKNFAD